MYGFTRCGPNAVSPYDILRLKPSPDLSNVKIYTAWDEMYRMAVPPHRTTAEAVDKYEKSYVLTITNARDYLFAHNEFTFADWNVFNGSNPPDVERRLAVFRSWTTILYNRIHPQSPMVAALELVGHGMRPGMGDPTIAPVACEELDVPNMALTSSRMPLNPLLDSDNPDWPMAVDDVWLNNMEPLEERDAEQVDERKGKLKGKEKELERREQLEEELEHLEEEREEVQAQLKEKQNEQEETQKEQEEQEEELEKELEWQLQHAAEQFQQDEARQDVPYTQYGMMIGEWKLVDEPRPAVAGRLDARGRLVRYVMAQTVDGAPIELKYTLIPHHEVKYLPHCDIPEPHLIRNMRVRFERFHAEDPIERNGKFCGSRPHEIKARTFHLRR